MRVFNILVCHSTSFITLQKHSEGLSLLTFCVLYLSLSVSGLRSEGFCEHTHIHPPVPNSTAQLPVFTKTTPIYRVSIGLL